MSDWLIQGLCLLGSLAILLAAIGIVRFPDFFARMHAATKASAFGLGLILLAVCIAHPQLNVVIKLVLAAIALFLTLPVASQALAEAERQGGRDDSEV